MDAVTLDHLIAELRPRLLGRHLRRPRCSRAHAVSFEISGDGQGRLWIDARRPSTGCYRLTREQLASLEGERESLPGRTRSHSSALAASPGTLSTESGLNFL